MRQIVVSIEEKGDCLHMVADNGDENGTPAENSAARIVAEAIAITLRNPDRCIAAGLGNTMAEARTRRDIEMDIKRAGS